MPDHARAEGRALALPPTHETLAVAARMAQAGNAASTLRRLIMALWSPLGLPLGRVAAAAMNVDLHIAATSKAKATTAGSAR